MPHEKFKVAKPLKKVVEIHDSPYIVVAHVIKVEDLLKDVEKRYQVASNFVEDKTH